MPPKKRAAAGKPSSKKWVTATVYIPRPSSKAQAATAGKTKAKPANWTKKTTYVHKYRSHHKRYRKARRDVEIVKEPGAVATRTLLTFKYNGIAPITSSGTNSNYTAIRGNSLYDPEYYTGGTQPYLYDRWTLIYKFYRVNACKVTFYFDHQGDIGLDAAAAVFTDESISQFTSFNTDTLGMLPYAKETIVPVRVAQDKPAKIKMYCESKKAFSVPDILDPGYSGTTGTLTTGGTNPQYQFFICCRWQTSNGVNFQANIGCVRFKVKYYCELFDPREIAASPTSPDSILAWAKRRDEARRAAQTDPNDNSEHPKGCKCDICRLAALHIGTPPASPRNSVERSA